MTLKFYDPTKPVVIHDKHLPHWRQDEVTYFVTSRLADSMPREKLLQWQQQRTTWLRAHQLQDVEQIKSLSEEEQHKFHQRFTALWHQWLDNGYGECWLKRPDMRTLLMDAFLRDHGSLYDLDAWAVMPNHFHVLVSPKTGSSLGDILKQWKGGSAREINRVVGRAGSLWQAEPYDHIVRSEPQFQHYRQYIARNPILARLNPAEYSLGIGLTAWDSAETLYKSLQPIDRGSSPRSTEAEG